MEGIPRVSVLIPVRDAATTLPACLKSLRRQTLQDWECVLVDDGSTDAGPEQVAEAARADSRIQLLRRPARGIVAALNEGLEACRAPLVARMDADDLMHRERLARQLAALEADPGLAGVGAHVRLFPRTGLRDGSRAYEAWLNAADGAEAVAREVFIECPIAHPTLVMRRDTLARHRWREQPWPEDYDLVLRLLAAGERLGVVPRRLLSWRRSRGRLSRTDPRYGLDRFTDCKAAFLAWGFLLETHEYILWGYGSTGRALRRALLKHGRRPSHIIELHPGRVGQTIHAAPVVGPEALTALPRRPIIASVSGAGPRAEIRARLEEMDFVEGRDFVVAA